MKIILPIVFALSTFTTFTARAQPAFSNALDTLFAAIQFGMTAARRASSATAPNHRPSRPDHR